MTPQKETRRRNAVITENTLSVKQTTIQASPRTGRRNAQTGMIILSLIFRWNFRHFQKYKKLDRVVDKSLSVKCKALSE